MNIVNMAAACPTGELQNLGFCHKCDHQEVAVQTPVALSSTGGVLFTNEVISWHVPRRVTPLLDGSFKIAEMHMGINGQRLDKSQMAKRGYTLTTTDFHIVLELPVGSPDGYYKVGEVFQFDVQDSGQWATCIFYSNAMNNCRAMPRITSTTSLILWSLCLRYYGGQLMLTMTSDTRFFFQLPPLWCFNRCITKTVRIIIIWNVVIFCGERYKPAVLFFRYCFRAPAVQCSLGKLPSWCGADEHHFLHWGSHYWGVHCQRFQCAGTHSSQWHKELLPTSAIWRWCRPETCMKLSTMQKVATNQMMRNSCLVSFLLFCNLQNPELLVTQYFLPLTFGFVIMPEQTTFIHPVELTVSLQDVGEIMLSVSASMLFCSARFTCGLKPCPT